MLERYQKPPKTLHGTLAELASQHLRNIGLANAKQIGSLNLLEAAGFHQVFDFEDELRLHDFVGRTPRSAASASFHEHAWVA